MYVKRTFEVSVLQDSQGLDEATTDQIQGLESLTEELQERVDMEVNELKEIIQTALATITLCHPTVDGISVTYVEE